MRIAMWSGPRTISTAMMRAWENRPDSAVIDEPFYALFLKATTRAHPGADEVIAHHESDWRAVIALLTGPIPNDAPIFFQKHMAHHLLPEIDRSWMIGMSNCFLIRDPREMLSSLVRIIPEPRLEDTGLPQQVEIFEFVRAQTHCTPPVLDAKDVVLDPERMLRALCGRLGVEFTERMLHWPAGPRDSDGIWAKHWYHNVERSTGFAPYRPQNEPLPDGLRDLCTECEAYYATLHAHRLI